MTDEDGAPHQIVVPAADTKDDVLDNFARELSFPAFFGHNYDALADSLGDFASQLSQQTTLTWRVSRQFSQQPGYAVISTILTQSQQKAPRASADTTLLNVRIEPQD